MGWDKSKKGGGKAMNLDLTRRVLAVVESQPFGFAKLRGRRIAREVDQMRAAGLVEVSAAQQSDPDIAVIKSVTPAGRRLLRVFESKRATEIARKAFQFSRESRIDLELCVL